MKKMTTLFKKNPNDLSLVIPEVAPENLWALEDDGVKVYRKWDGMACMIKDGILYKRFDSKVKRGKRQPVPEGAIPCQPEPDSGPAGHWPHWAPVTTLPEDARYREGHKNSWFQHANGTYELCGPGVSTERFVKNDNVERLPELRLIKHDSELVMTFHNGSQKHMTFPWWRDFLSRLDIEGVVFRHPDGRMCKLRKKDFGLARG
jgi:hypothetical protein